MISIIIPAFNKWKLTKQCLVSLKEHTINDIPYEVILVDNGSSDATPIECPMLGAQLFQENFTYLQQTTNRNFAQGCNIGAKAATHPYLFFLNNDTILTTDWLPPLLKKIQDNKQLGAVGPLLLYPKIGHLPDRVQHLGIAFSFNPTFVKHLHEGLPADHPVVQKERTLQAITGAALLLSKDLFFKVGCFDEEFINGFEDVELCARIKKQGYMFMIEPKSRIYHLESQTPGRKDHEAHNNKLLLKKIKGYFTTDWYQMIEADNLIPDSSLWLELYPALNPQLILILNKKLINPTMSAQEIEETLLKEPYWIEGLQWIITHKCKQKLFTEALSYLTILRKFFSDPFFEIQFFANILQANQDLTENNFSSIKYRILTRKQYSLCGQTFTAQYAENNRPFLAKKLMDWHANLNFFVEKKLHPLMKAISHIYSAELQAPKNKSTAYNIWVELTEAKQLENLAKTDNNSTKFSMFMDSPYFSSQCILGLQLIQQQTHINQQFFLISPTEDTFNLHQQEFRKLPMCYLPTNSLTIESALASMTGDWLIYFENRVFLSTYALSVLQKTIYEQPNVQFIYAKHDYLNTNVQRFCPQVQPLYNPELLLSNHTQAFTCIKKDFLLQLNEEQKKLPFSRANLASVLHSVPEEQTQYIPHILASLLATKDDGD